MLRNSYAMFEKIIRSDTTISVSLIISERVLENSTTPVILSKTLFCDEFKIKKNKKIAIK